MGGPRGGALPSHSLVNRSSTNTRTKKTNNRVSPVVLLMSSNNRHCDDAPSHSWGPRNRRTANKKKGQKFKGPTSQSNNLLIHAINSYCWVKNKQETAQLWEKHLGVEGPMGRKGKTLWTCRAPFLVSGLSYFSLDSGCFCLISVLICFFFYFSVFFCLSYVFLFWFRFLDSGFFCLDFVCFTSVLQRIDGHHLNKKKLATPKGHLKIKV